MLARISKSDSESDDAAAVAWPGLTCIALDEEPGADLAARGDFLTPGLATLAALPRCRGAVEVDVDGAAGSESANTPLISKNKGLCFFTVSVLSDAVHPRQLLAAHYTTPH